MARGGVRSSLHVAPDEDARTKGNLSASASKEEVVTAQERESFGLGKGLDWESYESERKKKNMQKMLRYYTLDSSGCPLLNIYLYMWALDDNNHSCRGFRIPDTVVVRDGAPVHWLFTNKEGEIKRKSEPKLHDRKLMLKSLRGKDKAYNEIVAIFIQQKGSSCQVTYMDHYNLEEFLYDEILPDGIIQRMVASPYPNSTNILTSTWYPSVFYLESSTCEMHPGLVQEDVTLKGIVSRDSVPDRLQQRVKTACKAIATHVNHVSPHGYSVSSMQLQWKHDIDGTLWLMWCSGMEVRTMQETNQTKTSTLPASSKRNTNNRNTNQGDRDRNTVRGLSSAASSCMTDLGGSSQASPSKQRSSRQMNSAPASRRASFSSRKPHGLDHLDELSEETSGPMGTFREGMDGCPSPSTSAPLPVRCRGLKDEDEFERVPLKTSTPHERTHERTMHSRYVPPAIERENNRNNKNNNRDHKPMYMSPTRALRLNKEQEKPSHRDHKRDNNNSNHTSNSKGSRHNPHNNNHHHSSHHHSNIHDHHSSNVSKSSQFVIPKGRPLAHQGKMTMSYTLDSFDEPRHDLGEVTYDTVVRRMEEDAENNLPRQVSIDTITADNLRPTKLPSISTSGSGSLKKSTSGRGLEISSPRAEEAKAAARRRLLESDKSLGYASSGVSFGLNAGLHLPTAGGKSWMYDRPGEMSIRAAAKFGIPGGPPLMPTWNGSPVPPVPLPQYNLSYDF